MNKYFFTFGSGHLKEFNVMPMDVMLVVEAENESKAREMIFNYPGIGEYFCTSYRYSKKHEFDKFNMIEYKLEDLEKKRITGLCN